LACFATPCFVMLCYACFATLRLLCFATLV
jgi:hypothetical protein